MDETFQHDTATSAQIVVELLRETLGYLETDRGAASELIVKACAMLDAANSPERQDVARGGLAPWQIAKVKAHVEANLDKPLVIAELASLARLGPSYFMRAFKRSFGVSPHAFILERRIRRAQTLMLTTGEKLSTIALRAGFSDQSHLTTRFHRATGMTPNAWRRERQHVAVEIEAA